MKSTHKPPQIPFHIELISKTTRPTNNHLHPPPQHNILTTTPAFPNKAAHPQSNYNSPSQSHVQTPPLPPHTT